MCIGSLLCGSSSTIAPIEFAEVAVAPYALIALVVEVTASLRNNNHGRSLFARVSAVFPPDKLR